jgi:NADP-dependent 3-hydroxy acid dehydrogenase YdfG
MGAATKAVVLTGASSGIGRATVARMAQSGWKVFATIGADRGNTALVC